MSVRYLGIRSAMGTPVLVGAEPVGLLYVDRRQASAQLFNREDLMLLIFVGRLIASAVAGSKRFARLDAEVRAIRGSGPAGGDLVGDSPATRTLRQIIEQKIGPTRTSVLLVGETGTGKNVAARAIHLASPRRRGPFVAVNCAAIPRELLESELFGHEKGAFSGADRRKLGQFEVASGGTLFLDEVGELDPAAQAKLLSVIEERNLRRVGGTATIDIDVRIVAATNRDLKRAVEAGGFREDLYYRLNVIRQEIPPLRERPEDISALARHLLGVACREVGRRIPGISEGAMLALARYPWPGNVRELANCLERAVVFADEGVPIGKEHLPEEILQADADKPAAERGSEEERKVILQALERAEGNKREAARILGWYPQKLYDRLRRHGIGTEWS